MVEALSSGPQNPGSLIEFSRMQGHDEITATDRTAYTEALTQYRMGLAEAKGVTLEELHEGTLHSVGRVSLREVADFPEQSAA